jgi:hypothetical protein
LYHFLNFLLTAAYPNTYHPGSIHGTNSATKGYANMPFATNPVHGQYWNGFSQTYPQYNAQQYGDYQTGYGAYNTGYPQNGAYYPQPYYQQPYAQYGQNYYGQYPGFDAQYWSGQYYPQQMPLYQHQVPVYHPGVPMYPVYHGQQNYYGHSGYYPNQQFHGGYPYHKKRIGKGFLGGTGHSMAKTLLGAAVVGVVAGTVAKKG